MTMESVKTEKKSGVFIIKLPDQLNGQALRSLESQAKMWLIDSSQIFVLDCSCVTLIARQVYPFLVQMSRKLRANGKSLYSVSASKDITTQLVEDGLKASLNLTPTLTDVFVRNGIQDIASA
ncbi:MAG: STAS domain-containing protein [Bdellovibrionales bacterium]